jgi:hypothetical protein
LGDLLHAKLQLDVSQVSFVNRTEITQIAFPLRRFFRQDVAFVSMLPFDLSRTGKRKSLFRSGSCLHFRHLFSPFITISSSLKKEQ